MEFYMRRQKTSVYQHWSGICRQMQSVSLYPVLGIAWMYTLYWALQVHWHSEQFHSQLTYGEYLLDEGDLKWKSRPSRWLKCILRFCSLVTAVLSTHSGARTYIPWAPVRAREVFSPMCIITFILAPWVVHINHFQNFQTHHIKFMSSSIFSLDQLLHLYTSPLGLVWDPENLEVVEKLLSLLILITF